MSVYGGIDVHRKRSQVAVIDAKGEALANRNVPNGVEPILKVIGGPPPGPPAALHAAGGPGGPGGVAPRPGLDPPPLAPLPVPEDTAPLPAPYHPHPPPLSHLPLSTPPPV